MKKILIITEVFDPEPGLVNDFVKHLKARGFYIDILTHQPSYPYGRVYEGYANDEYTVEEWDGGKIHRFKVVEGYRESLVRKLLNYISFVRRGSRIARKIGGLYDYILVYQTGPLTVAIPGVKIKKKFGTPLGVWTFDIWPDAVYAYNFPKVFPLTAFLNYIIGMVYKNADNIFISSRMFAETIATYVPNKQLHYTPNWFVEEKREQCEVNLAQNKINITFAGNISAAQNLENVLLGWEAAGMHDCVLNIVGDGSKSDELKKMTHERRIEGVVFHGRYPSSQIGDLLERSDILLLPLISKKGIEKTEPFKIQSYLKAGKPIFGVISGAGKEIIERNKLGIVAEPDNIADIADGFKKIVKFSDINRKEISSRATSLIEERFNRDKIIDKIVEELMRIQLK